MNRYKVTCLECGETDVLTVDGANHYVKETERQFDTNLLAFRWRPDLMWGFQCKCGNDNRLAPQEADQFDKLVKGDPLSLKKIAASLLVPDAKQFEMVGA